MYYRVILASADIAQRQTQPDRWYHRYRNGRARWTELRSGDAGAHVQVGKSAIPSVVTDRRAGVDEDAASDMRFGADHCTCHHRQWQAVWVSAPPAPPPPRHSPRRLNSDTTDPDEPSTLPKRTTRYTVPEVRSAAA